ncbi:MULTISPECIES: cobyrinate a,c-diamide synthase [unclassified Streptomyces]|uniref:cobyrinate a,c-diamide synthase n=1 Tax=unclassified Streptomyces TaxID=2593676 RepID=UPI002553827F|nr:MULTISPECIES: cobyrinate a,c-diamide synthase [unclassified Streptomyces]WRZ64085.1 cobyrinate a,c-diamide synthase [Streptomyces sp. NBC_01257]
MVSVPRLVIAAPASGSGKTTVATGLMAAFAGRGLAVSGHKVGPDYIDPGYHALATGRPGRNLDAYMCGPELIAPLFAHGAQGCDLAVVEGVMGLYDGASGHGELASTAQVATLLRAPVVLVVDASSQSRSVAALVHGFASWDTQVRIGGVILNKVGSDRHEALLREALDESGVPVLGVLRRAGQVAVPSRHLGLVPVAERRSDAVAAVAAMGDRVRAGCDLEALLALARSAPPVPGAGAWSAAEAVGACGGPVPLPARSRNRGSVPDPAPQTPEGLGGAEGLESTPEGRKVAVASGPAFTFSYAEHSELLAAAGATVVPFDPLRDEALPEGTAGLVVGGGFPEVYAPELSANEPLRKAVAELVASGAPVAAECAGLLYLARSLDGLPMCGVLDAEARMSERLTLGYRDAVALSDSVLAVAGTRMRGHEFHRTVLEPGAGDAPAWGVHQPERRVEGFVQQGVHASYLHVHWASAPGAARRFVERCKG